MKDIIVRVVNGGSRNKRGRVIGETPNSLSDTFWSKEICKTKKYQIFENSKWMRNMEHDKDS